MGSQPSADCPIVGAVHASLNDQPNVTLTQVEIYLADANGKPSGSVENYPGTVDCVGGQIINTTTGAVQAPLSGSNWGPSLRNVTPFFEDSLGVALTHNIVYSAFALMGALLGAAGIFVLLGADFLVLVQLLVYVGGILVLSLFAIMLTHRIADVQVSNRSVGRGVATVLIGLVLVALTRVALRATWVTGDVAAPAPTTYGVGSAFLGDFVLPFEVASLVLLVALIGAVMVSRKELRG